MIPRYVEMFGRAYPLRFTARALVRTAERLDTPFVRLFHTGEAGLCALFYCALCECLPQLTLDRARALYCGARRQTPQLADTLLRAFIDSGFDREGMTRAQLERLQNAASRAGYPDPARLEKMTLGEIHRALQAHLRAHGRAALMSGDEMKESLLSFAGRQHDDA